jgi:alkanesulfonate monooxygenase SsuD/methylene tetrahydromethanopterin reductase-like flavin-dependent oxidoreductase (luciferase family)
MHVGYTVGFQNPGDALADDAVYETDRRLIDYAVDAGFDSIWVVEHHFSDYFMSPDPLQYLTWVAARYPHVGLGTGVVVLPWRDPVRSAEQIAMLDTLSGGRVILGIGRGLGRTEYDGFRVDMATSRERFIAYAEMILDSLESGVIEADNEFVSQPARQLRPRPTYSLRGRTYAAAMSPESMPLMAKLGVGVLIVPQKPWEMVRADLATYQQTWRDAHGIDHPVPAPLCAGNIMVDADSERARELAFQYIGAYYDTVIQHYGFAKQAHQGLRGYEFYANISKYIDRRGEDGAIADYVNLMPWGTPDQVIEKITTLTEMLGAAAIMPSFNFGGMPEEVAQSSLGLFAREVLPALREIKAPELAPAQRHASEAFARLPAEAGA